ncbi:hypothetical protein CAPTEDRAFT_199261 [Capitella teleta]|uniref:F-box domain-containing protein n=1 Tax=Capitella teleta TaxID=283909 RepID=R7UCU5_CAPTE|nr:hypothetical protein CAPTEDRAFT_199261 [Capitella teleta]|eukprot:ELU03814.1 hypothetical protein CAPTEDRAFT_199261 [Capitella teleta]
MGETSNFTSDNIVGVDDSGSITSSLVPRDGTATVHAWEHLPRLTLEKVMSYLDYEERLNMALVCSHWLHAFNCPQLWRKWNVVLGRNAIKEIRRLLQFSRQHAQHLHSLRIQCGHLRFMAWINVERMLIRVFSCLVRKGAQLKKVELIDFHSNRRGTDDALLNSLVAALVLFLRTQKRLQIVNFSDAFFSRQNGLNVIRALTADKSSMRIKYLNIQDLFQKELPLFDSRVLRIALRHCRHLRTLEMNYSCLSESIIDTFLRMKDLCLLDLKVDGQGPHSHTISTDKWSALRKANPTLRVAVYLERFADHLDIRRVVNHRMPVSEFQMWTGMNSHARPWFLKDSLLYVAENFSQHLQVIMMTLAPDLPVDDAVILLLTKCRCLQTFELQCPLDLLTVQTIYDMLINRRIGLRQLYLTVDDLSEAELIELEATVALYECDLDPELVVEVTGRESFEE